MATTSEQPPRTIEEIRERVAERRGGKAKGWGKRLAEKHAKWIREGLAERLHETAEKESEEREPETSGV